MTDLTSCPCWVCSFLLLHHLRKKYNDTIYQSQGKLVFNSRRFPIEALESEILERSIGVEDSRTKHRSRRFPKEALESEIPDRSIGIEKVLKSKKDCDTFHGHFLCLGYPDVGPAQICQVSETC